MNVSIRWLREMVPGLKGTAREIAEHLALRGAPVEEISSPGEGLGDVVIARVITAVQHPNADRLSLCETGGPAPCRTGRLRKLVRGFVIIYERGVCL
jgi:hypothetical protein